MAFADVRLNHLFRCLQERMEPHAGEVAMVQVPVHLDEDPKLVLPRPSSNLARLLDEVLVAGRGEHGGETGGQEYW